MTTDDILDLISDRAPDLYPPIAGDGGMAEVCGELLARFEAAVVAERKRCEGVLNQYHAGLSLDDARRLIHEGK